MTEVRSRRKSAPTAARPEHRVKVQHAWAGTPPHRRGFLIWAIIASVFAIDVIWLTYSSLSVERAGVRTAVCGTGFLIAIAVFYGVTKRSEPIQRTAMAAAQCIAFMAIGAVLSYLVTATNAPLVDHVLLSADARLGFDWTAWAGWVDSRIGVHWFLAISYWLLFPELILCLMWLPLAGSADELIGLIIVSALITILCSGFLPAIGHLPHASQVASVKALRAGTMHVIQLSHAQGLITFPSFHTALALVLVYASRTSRVLFRITCVVTVCVLLSVPSEGGHYLSDMIGGVAVAIVAAAIVPRSWARASEKTYRPGGQELCEVGSSDDDGRARLRNANG